MTALVIGAGPAGLMAAEVMAQAGLSVTVADTMPSVGRKFLMAGKSGLNLTKTEPAADFIAAYGNMPDPLRQAVQDLGPDAVCNWAEGLGQPLFTGSTGRVFPKVMKASPLLRAWLGRLDGLEVTLRTRWRWQGWENGQSVFDTPEGRVTLTPTVTVLALGGASWARLGSDGAWSRHLSDHLAPFAPANMGFIVHWSDHMTRHLGAPVKSVALHAGDLTSRGEWVISQRGIEGGGVYAVSRAMREGQPLLIDLMPDWPADRIRTALARSRGKTSLSNHLRKALRLDPVRLALLSEFGRPFPDDLAVLIKRLPVAHNGPRPMDEAISTAGGVRFNALDDGLMLRDRPGVFCAGEMLDWVAPTGGYLITGCLATGRLAGNAAARYAQGQQ
ncbi:TIGR03862 family flavoprotein [Loktanella agnita]|uniref:TIGR03862 family flavoprotein n=1 Tax=Loktanella agnita TaxID=287097 RepID=UPI00398A1B83